MRPRGREYRKKLRDEARQFLQKYKLRVGCADCGYAEHPAALDFDHRDPSTKLFNPSQFARHSWQQVLEEIKKCDVRCANCHRVKHARETG